MNQVSRQPKKDLGKELEKKLTDINLKRQEEEAIEYAKSVNLPYVSLTGYPIDTGALGIISEADAIAGQLVIISKSGKNLKVALLGPDKEKTKEILKKLSDDGYEYSLAITSANDFKKALERYKEIKRKETVKLGVISIAEAELPELEKQIEGIENLKNKLASLPMTRVVNIIIAGALKVGASDAHLENEENNIRLRYRIDGILIDIVSMPKRGYDKLLSRVKLMAGLKINIHNEPQDGRFTVRQADLDIEIRTSIMPSEYGENVVLRFLDPRNIKQGLKELGMREDTLETTKKLLKKTTGAIVTTGPTGSGKTTTLYAFLRHVNSPDLKIITIENPIEYHLPGITQTQVNPQAGYTFASGLRSIVRQDPDVILVGEIRDAETAEIAMQAALTGHRVFSTIHTNNAAGSLPRLIDLGVKPVTIGPALNAAMAQRLARKLCPECKIKRKPAQEELKQIQKVLSEGALSDPAVRKKAGLPSTDSLKELYFPSKCEGCHMTGYKGRVGLFEIFEVDSDMEKLIHESPSVSEINELAVQKGMITIIQDGFIKAIQGITTVNEIMRVAG